MIKKRMSNCLIKKTFRRLIYSQHRIAALAEFILEMGNSSQMGTFPMKTRLNINLETEIRLRISTDINLRRVR